MGVRGLETFLEKYSHGGCYEVKIEDIVSKYRQETHKEPVIVVDGLSILKYLYGDLCWINGGQYKEYIEHLTTFVNNFKKLGVKLVFFYDGLTMPVKQDTWLKRRRNDMQKIHDLFDTISNGVLPSTDPRQHPIFLIPAFLTGTTKYILQHVLGCEISVSTRDCDEEIADYAKKNKCFAILGQDSDFIIFEGAKYYLSMKNFNLKLMTTLNYDREQFARSLSLCPSQLPLLASLLGNDIIAHDDVKNFHCQLMRSNWVPFQKLIPEMARFVHHYPEAPVVHAYLKQIAKVVFKDQSKAEALWTSICSYDPSKTSPVMLDPFRGGLEDGVWPTILCRAKHRHLCNTVPGAVYQILNHGVFRNSTTVEDVRKKDLPPNGKFSLNLRQRTYGVLLHEKPLAEGQSVHTVNEWFVIDIESFNNANPVRPIYPTCDHPGLLALWDGEGEAIEEARWELFRDAMFLPPKGVTALRSLPQHLCLLATTLRYIHDNKAGVDGWELDAMIGMGVYISNCSLEQVSAIPAVPLIPRAIRLMNFLSWLIRILLLFLSSCGGPNYLMQVEPYNFIDGNLFSHFYRRAQPMKKFEQICVVGFEDVFQQVQTFVFNRDAAETAA